MLRTLKITTCFATLTAIAGCSAILGISSDPRTESGDGGTTLLSGDGGTCTGTLYIRIASDFSGTATDIAIPHFWGLYDHLRELNANGGINGCQIDIDVQDNHYTGPQTVTVVQNWRTTDPNWSKVNTVFIFGTGPTTSAGPDIMNEKKVIIPGSYAGAFDTPGAINKTINYDQITAQADPTTPFTDTPTSEVKTSAGWSYVFYPATDYGTGIRLAIQAAQKINPGRIAFAHDTPAACAYCVDPLAAGKSFVPNLSGMKLGRDLMIPQTSTDDATVTTNVTAYIEQEIAQFKAQNTKTKYDYEPVQWIWSGNSVFASAIVGKAVAAEQAKIDADTTIKDILSGNGRTWKIRVMANNWGIGETTPTICGTDCNGDIMYGLFPVPRYGDLANSSSMAQLTATRDSWAQKDQTTPPPAPITKRAYNDYRDVRYVQGYAAATMWETAVRNALKTGITSPTGDDIKNALEKFTQQDLGGLTAGPITFTTTDHRPQSNEVIYKVDSGGNLAFVDRYSITLTEEWLGY